MLTDLKSPKTLILKSKYEWKVDDPDLLEIAFRTPRKFPGSAVVPGAIVDWMRQYSTRAARFPAVD
jgi:hypothetical protein